MKRKVLKGIAKAIAVVVALGGIAVIVLYYICPELKKRDWEDDECFDYEDEEIANDFDCSCCKS